MIFSHRYLRAIEIGRISIEIEPDVRKKIWRQLSHFNASLSIQRDPNDRWISHSSILEEVSEEIKTEHAWDFLPGESDVRDDSSSLSAMQNLVIDGSAQYVFDVIEMAYVWMEADQRDLFRKKINEIFELYECPWRLSDGELFKLDSDFIGARLAVMAHDALAGNSFAGAADEYARSRQNYNCLSRLLIQR